MPCALRTLDIWSIHNFTLYVSPTEVQRRLLAHIRKVWIGQISESQLFNIFLWIRKMRKNLLTWKYFRQFAIAARPFSDRVAYAESQFRFHLCSAALSVHAYKPAYFPIWPIQLKCCQPPPGGIPIKVWTTQLTDAHNIFILPTKLILLRQILPSWPAAHHAKIAQNDAQWISRVHLLKTGRSDCGEQFTAVCCNTHADNLRRGLRFVRTSRHKLSSLMQE